MGRHISCLVSMCTVKVNNSTLFEHLGDLQHGLEEDNLVGTCRCVFSNFTLKRYIITIELKSQFRLCFKNKMERLAPKIIKL